MKEKADSKQKRARGGSGGARALNVRTITVLHIDDDPNDTELLRAAAKRAEAPFVLRNVEDGDRAVAYLSGLGIYADREHYQQPSLILLDLKMPRATGLEILKWIRANSQWNKIPVLVLSGSELKDDITQAYAMGANSYLVKPLGFEALVSLVKSINTVWLAPPGAP
jgi:CheY-like chemotaxis protein